MSTWKVQLTSRFHGRKLQSIAANTSAAQFLFLPPSCDHLDLLAHCWGAQASNVNRSFWQPLRTMQTASAVYIFHLNCLNFHCGQFSWKWLEFLLRKFHPTIKKMSGFAGGSKFSHFIYSGNFYRLKLIAGSSICCRSKSNTDLQVLRDGEYNQSKSRRLKNSAIDNLRSMKEKQVAYNLMDFMVVKWSVNKSGS